ncbi:glutamate racemase [Patescibacteria group bacterium]|nr:MAG: glutamate racemase [Patescibacteria group bacterium]
MRIGVFDSGVGGKAVALKLQQLLPNADIMSVDDHVHVPYGDRTPDDIIELTKAAIQPLLAAKCDAIVIACNTATTVAIAALRATYPSVNFIGIEPMVKPAASATKSGIIAVLATPRTLQSDRYNELKRTWAKDSTVIEPDCSDWAKLIEDGHSSQIHVEATVVNLLQQKVDVIVLGCTHYHMIKERILDAAGDTVTVLEPTDAIANRIKSLLS